MSEPVVTGGREGEVDAEVPAGYQDRVMSVESALLQADASSENSLPDSECVCRGL